MTKHGFFSAVCARSEAGVLHSPPDPNKVMVRARNCEHLQNLLDAYPDILEGKKIIKNMGTDYPCRIFMPKKMWLAVVERMSKDLDYPNFKEEVYKSMPDDVDYSASLMTVWVEMQRNSPWKTEPPFSETPYITDDFLEK